MIRRIVSFLAAATLLAGCSVSQLASIVMDGPDGLKTKFFEEVRKEAVKQGNSPTEADCMVADLKAKITQAEINAILDNGGKMPDSVKEKFAAASLSCKLGPAAPLVK